MRYFIRAGAEGPIKIGKADDVECRLRSLQTAHYEELSVMAVDTEFESSLHRAFADDQIRGEWFRPSVPLLTYIASTPGRRELPKPSLVPAFRLPDSPRTNAEILIAALARNGGAFLPDDLLRMISGSQAGGYNRLTKQNATIVALEFTTRVANGAFSLAGGQ